jgi:hypothetical protein
MKRFLLFSFFLLVLVCAAYIYQQQAIQDAVKKAPAKHKKEGPTDRTDIVGSFTLDSPKDTEKLLQILFEPVKIKGDTAIWKPYPQARLNMHVCDDGMCHTNIDTIIRIPYTDTSKDEYLILLTTMLYDTATGEQVFGAHVDKANYGYAFVDKYMGHYMVSAFDVDFTDIGCWGGVQGDSVWLQRVGKDNYALGISSGYTNSGQTTETAELFDLNGMTPIFSFDFYDDDAGLADSTDPQYQQLYEHMEAKLVLIPNKKNTDWYDIKLVTDSNHYAHHKLVTTVNTELYRWNENDARYEKLR